MIAVRYLPKDVGQQYYGNKSAFTFLRDPPRTCNCSRAATGFCSPTVTQVRQSCERLPGAGGCSWCCASLEVSSTWSLGGFWPRLDFYNELPTKHFREGRAPGEREREVPELVTSVCVASPYSGKSVHSWAQVQNLRCELLLASRAAQGAWRCSCGAMCLASLDQVLEGDIYRADCHFLPQAPAAPAKLSARYQDPSRRTTLKTRLLKPQMQIPGPQVRKADRRNGHSPCLAKANTTAIDNRKIPESFNALMPLPKMRSCCGNQLVRSHSGWSADISISPCRCLGSRTRKSCDGFRLLNSPQASYAAQLCVQQHQLGPQGVAQGRRIAVSIEVPTPWRKT